MTLTTKDPQTTLCLAEQIELRRFMKNPDCQLGVSQSEPIRRQLVESLAAKGYVRLTATKNGFDYYALTEVDFEIITVKMRPLQGSRIISDAYNAKGEPIVLNHTSSDYKQVMHDMITLKKERYDELFPNGWTVKFEPLELLIQ